VAAPIQQPITIPIAGSVMTCSSVPRGASARKQRLQLAAHSGIVCCLSATHGGNHRGSPRRHAAGTYKCHRGMPRDIVIIADHAAQMRSQKRGSEN
jgi:hypothetical protein